MLQEVNPNADPGEVFTLFMFSLTAGGTLFKVNIYPIIQIILLVDILLDL